MFDVFLLCSSQILTSTFHVYGLICNVISNSIYFILFFSPFQIIQFYSPNIWILYFLFCFVLVLNRFRFYILFSLWLLVLVNPFFSLLVYYTFHSHTFSVYIISGEKHTTGPQNVCSVLVLSIGQKKRAQILFSTLAGQIRFVSYFFKRIQSIFFRNFH